MPSTSTSGHALRRDVGITLFALYGTGNIIGAGIYVLVGKVAGEAGLLAPVAFVIAAIIAGLTGLSYGELAARYPVSAGEAVYLHKAFKRRWLSVLAGFLIAIAGLVSAATMARGFVGYLNQFVSVDSAVAMVALIASLTLLAIRGIAESARAAALLTLIEAGGLLWIIAVAAPDPAQFTELLSLGVQDADASAVPGIFAAAFLAFFAFIGFEDMVSIAEEVKQPERNIPRGIVLAFAISTVLYLLVTLVAIATLPVAELAASEAPLADVYRAATDRSVVFISLIGLVAVINGALIQIIKAARVFYGMSCNGWLPAFFGVVNARTRTPLRSTVFAGSVVLVLALLLPLVSLAKITSAMVLTVFILVNLALIRIKRIGPPPEGVRSVPGWVPVSGVLLSAVILLSACASAPSGLYSERPAEPVVATTNAVELTAADGRRVPLRIVYPLHGESYPLIVLSHGTFSSNDRYDRIARYWAEQGYVVILPQHKDANYGVTPTGYAVMQEVAMSRVADMSQVLDELADIQRQVPALAGKIDHDHYVAAGHSIGTQVAMLVTGMQFKTSFSGELIRSDEQRYTALVLVSDPGKMRLMPLDIWTASNVPTFMATGTDDFGLMGQRGEATEAQSEVVPSKMKVPRYQLLLDGGDHYFGGLVQKEVDAKPDHEGLAIFNATSTAFLDAQTKGSAAAQRYLDQVDLLRVTNRRAELERLD